MMQKQKSVRELGGEIWAELNYECGSEVSPLSHIDYVTLDQLTDFVMSILARHIDTVIVNDEGLEVEPRPRSNPTGTPPVSP